jgi:carbamoyltransferase
MTTILGLNAYHADSAAAIVVDGEIVGAVEEERFLRLKHWAGFPTEAIRWCLAEAGVDITQVDHVAVNQDPRANLRRRVGYAVRRRPSPQLVLERLRNQRKRVGIRDEIREHFGSAPPVTHVEHHLAHLASSFWITPYDDAVLLSVDGFGDFASCAWGAADRSGVRIDGRILFPHSLGLFYEALTQYLGFPHYGDEYKVMGLAPYGEPRYVEQLKQVVLLQDDGTFELNLECFRHHRESVGYVWENTTPHSGTLYSDALVDLLGPPRDPSGPLEDAHRDLARSIQVVYEDAFFNLLAMLAETYDSRRLCLSGGCAANSVANGKVHLRSPFTESFVAPSGGDAGGAIGAALQVLHDLGNDGRATDSAYLGPSYTADQIRSTLDEAQCGYEVIDDESELCARTADAIANGEVVGWYQGRLEWGPRALGSRSIVCDPRRGDMKEILNAKIKRRESFRPFAPSILHEREPEWFEHDAPVPYMSKVFQIRADKRAEIPAVTHVDGSGRLQTVDRDANPRYHRLISAFEARTGVPIVLNTSFNENEPIVCTPREALDCFLRTNMDVLVLGDHFVRR